MLLYETQWVSEEAFSVSITLSCTRRSNSTFLRRSTPERSFINRCVRFIYWAIFVGVTNITIWFQCFFRRVHLDLALFKRELRKKVKLWDMKGTDAITLPDAVTRVPPSLLFPNSMLPVESHYVLQRDDGATKEDYWNRGIGTGRSESNVRWRCRLVLKVCLDASEERCREMSTKIVLLRYILEAVREAEVPVDHPSDHEDDDQNCIVCYIKRVNVFKQWQWVLPILLFDDVKRNHYVCWKVPLK